MPTKASLCFYFLAIAVWLSATSAFAQEAAPDITLKLSPAEVAEITRLVDLAAPSTFIAPPPLAYWDLQTKISDTLEANPDAARAVAVARAPR
ncbi:hypothetical protein [Bradyrhizobium erythrophlei]|uniref:Uncharacterized protein n=1 Tax=Bradyrhizobium erythrophlei TaxID=1437360 RepID=A0A1M5SHE1_9BRAD|nr:hypothetical protein [Bradyrhizobium erythrophlei]SHH38012.1 hypothetical protein SAMN05443248_4612 [Bradyrhizobium erythrophlei]